MSLQTRLVALAQAIGADIKTLSESIPTGGPTTTLDGGATPTEAYTGEVMVLEGTDVPSLVQAKGDLFAGSGVANLQRLPVGTTTGHILTVDPLSSVGISWQAPPGPAATLDLPTEYSSTTPATPSTGISLFSRARARRLLASIGPAGQDTVYQPALFSNRIAKAVVVNNVAAPTLDGLATANYSTPAAVSSKSTSFYEGMVRTRYSSTTSAGTLGGIRSNTSQWFLSSTTNLGGFFFVCRFGLGAITATNRVFIGLRTAAASTTSTVEAAFVNNNPSTMTNMIGLGCDSADTTFQMMCNDASGTATKTNLGANFPAQTAATWFFEFRMFAPAGGGQNVSYSLVRLNDGVMASGQITTDLPAVGTMLAAHVIHGNGTTSSVASLDFQSLYVETDN